LLQKKEKRKRSQRKRRRNIKSTVKRGISSELVWQFISVSTNIHYRMCLIQFAVQETYQQF